MLSIKSGKLDFIGNYNQSPTDNRPARNVENYLDINPYWYHEHFTGKCRDFLKEIIDAMYGKDYFDHSDAQIDYFHCSHYIDINVGNWNKPYQLEQ